MLFINRLPNCMYRRKIAFNSFLLGLTVSKVAVRQEWRLFILISRANKWGTLKSAGNPRCAALSCAEIHSICTDRPRPGSIAGVQVSPPPCQSVAILMNRRHFDLRKKLCFVKSRPGRVKQRFWRFFVHISTSTAKLNIL